jgi:integrase
MSEGLLVHTLQKLGFRGEQTAHGFRASFQTLCKEQGIADTDTKKEAIELQLAHWRGSERAMNYDRSKLLETRREVLQAWGDYCDQLRAGE